MIAFDTSVVVAAFATWHDAHGRASAALGRKPRLPGQVFVETYSVLTRLPPPHRAPAGLVREFLDTTFREPLLTLPAREHRPFVRIAAEAGIGGGAVYDALIGFTAKNAKAVLLTLDRRAIPVYETLGVEYEVLG